MEQVLFEQHVRLVNGVNRVVGPKLRLAIEIATLFVAVACAISLFILHVIYITNSSNSHVNCLMTYFDAQNLSKPSLSKHQYDLIKLTVVDTMSQNNEQNDLAQECFSDISSCNASFTNTVGQQNYRDQVYLFSMDKGSLMLADETMRYHNFSVLDIAFPAHASCFGPPLTSQVIKQYLGYDLIVLNWAVAAFEGEGYMYKTLTRELFNLNYAGDFVSKKGVSLAHEKHSVRYKDPLVLPTLVVEALSSLGIGELGLSVCNTVLDRLHMLWVTLESSESLRPLTKHLSWVFADEFTSTSASGSTVNSLANLLYSAYTITNTRWQYISQQSQLNQYLVFRLGVVFSTTFLFFVTTTLVSYTLRETQERMLRFTHQLQHHINNDLPYWTLVFSHLVESLVFVPIIMGIHFFLVEFFSDQLLAFMMLLMVWMGEVFSVLSLRSRASIRYFPKLFCGYFYLFHVYFFCFPYGFSYLAWLTTMLFVLHSTMHLMNHYEIPAFEQGVVNMYTPRVGLMDLTAQLQAQNEPPVPVGGNGAVFRRMQALRRAAQLAEANSPSRNPRNTRNRTGSDTGLPPASREGRNRTSSGTTVPSSLRGAAASNSADNLAAANANTGANNGAARVRGASIDLPKSKFALAPIPPHRSSSAGRRAVAEGAGNAGNAGNNNSTSGSSSGASPKTNGAKGPGAKKKSTSRLPILALGRSESMALYTDSTMTEEEYLEQQMQEQQASAQAEAMALLSQDNVAKKGKKAEGANADGVEQVPLQRSASGDSDFGLLLYNSDEEDGDQQQGKDRAQPRTGELDDGDEDEYSSECSEEQEEEERRFFVFGGVTGAGPATNSTNTTHPQGTTSATAGGVPKKAKTHRKKKSERSEQPQGSVAQKPSMVPNIYESVESRRARLMHQQQNPGANGPSASAAACNRALELSQSSQASQGSYGASEFSVSSPYYSPLKDDASPAPSQSSAGSTKPASQPSQGSAQPSAGAKPASTATAATKATTNSNNMRESLSDYGFESQQDFSVFGNLLKKK